MKIGMVIHCNGCFIVLELALLFLLGGYCLAINTRVIDLLVSQLFMSSIHDCQLAWTKNSLCYRPFPFSLF